MLQYKILRNLPDFIVFSVNVIAMLFDFLARHVLQTSRVSSNVCQGEVQRRQKPESGSHSG